MLASWCARMEGRATHFAVRNRCNLPKTCVLTPGERLRKIAVKVINHYGDEVLKVYFYCNGFPPVSAWEQGGSRCFQGFPCIPNIGVFGAIPGGP